MTEQKPKYLTDALEMIGLSEPKQIIQEVSGFVPVFEAILEKYDDHITALVFGRRWQYCRMPDGVCNASLDRIAKDLKISAATVMRHTEKLVEDGYLIDLTPDLRNVPHTYADAGLVVMKSQLSASVSQRNTSISQGKATVSQSQLIKDSIRQELEREIFTALESLTGSLSTDTPRYVDIWLEKHSGEWILKAIEETKSKGARSVKYIDKVLISWEANGYPKTRDEQVQAARKDKNANKGIVEKITDIVYSAADIAAAERIKARRAGL